MNSYNPGASFKPKYNSLPTFSPRGLPSLRPSAPEFTPTSSHELSASQLKSHIPIQPFNPVANPRSLDVGADDRSTISDEYDSDDGYKEISDNNANNDHEDNFSDQNYENNEESNNEENDSDIDNGDDYNNNKASGHNCVESVEAVATPSDDPWSHFLQQRFTLLEDALTDSLLGGKFDDVELCAYTRRSRIGTVHSPVFVNSRAAFLAAASPILKELVQSDNQTPRYISVQYHEYGYDDDSDIEDDDAEPLVDASEQSSLEGLEIASNDSSTDDDNVEKITIKLRSNAVFVPHAAAKTWQVLVGYLYTGRLVFTTLRSSRSPEYTPPECRISCSPKSMYRLAAKLQIHVLKKRSETAIIADLSPENIVKEVFSDFSWRYPEILKVEVEYFRKHARNPSVQEELKKAIKTATSGKMKQGEVVLNALFDTLF